MGETKNVHLFPETKDVIVEGARGAGLAAALTLADSGAEAVLFQVLHELPGYARRHQDR